MNGGDAITAYWVKGNMDSLHKGQSCLSISIEKRSFIIIIYLDFQVAIERFYKKSIFPFQIS